MSEEDKSQKTEEPTEKKLSDERKKGNVPNSKEVGVFMGVFSLMVFTVFLLPGMSAGLMETLGILMKNPAGFTIGEDVEGIRDLGNATKSLIYGLGLILLPLGAILIAGAILAAFLQGEVVVSQDRIKPKWSNISPVSGFKRIYSVSGLVEFIKSIVKVSIVLIISYFVLYDALNEIVSAYNILPQSIPQFIREKTALLLIYVMSLLSAVAIFDMIWKRMEHRKKLRMSMREIKDEHKQTEGDPHIKAKLAEIRRKRSRQNMMKSVPTATVIITNPTHYAIALKYEMGSAQPAPVCVAKGLDLVALKIREIAKENNVPIIESPPLARTLHATTEIDDVIPYEHWKAVAEIISFIMSINSGNKKAKPPEGSKLSDS